MSRKVTLYIAGLRADLPDESPIQFNWTREDLDNPTTVRNSYTQQLTLPGTPANDAIFGHFGRVERAVQTALGQSAGIYYNPLKKADFALYADDMTVLARGYCKLDQITSRGDQATSYKISLYGGLGSLFYDLSWNDDGTERTLADLIYDDGNGGDLDPHTEGLSVDRVTLQKLWSPGLYDTPPSWAHIMTYAPCYNGLPAGDFDANKALVSQVAFYNFPGEAGYTPLGGGSAVLATFASKHTEWEVRDFRAYLQRPVVSIKAVLEALGNPANTSGWTLALDGAFFQSGTNPWYDDAWLTLPLIQEPEDGDWTALHLSDALGGGAVSPAQLLIGYAKQFGLVFHVDDSTRTVTLMARDDYYVTGDTILLTERVDIDTVEIVPCNASARWYEMKAKEVDAEYTKEYEDAYGRVYGSQRIDTGWEFDASVKDLLPSFPFKGAADVLETSPNFYLNYYSSYGVKHGLAMVDTESVKYRLYDGSGNAKDFDAYVGQYVSKTYVWYDAANHGYDFAPKVQLHGADGKASDGAGVLLFLVGETTLPGAGYMDWHTSDDTAEMGTLNEGRPCWIMAGATTTSITKIPHFRRMAGAQTMDFGAPREIAVPGESTGEGASVYYNRWKGYLADRLDKDTKVLTCKVDWRGHKVGASLLRHFYWYRNTLWSLNKIRNYAPTLDALTECEFVQVQSRAAYEASQDVPAMANWYLNATPGVLNFSPSGETLTITITANVSWTLTVPAWITASAASGTGNATVTLTAGANSGTDRSGTVSLSGDHSTSASVSVSQETAFVPSLSVSPNNRTYDANARTFYYTVTCNGRWRVKSISGAWITCTSSGTGNGTATISIAANTGGNRTAYIMWEMTDYPATTYTTYITQSAPAAVVTYSLELGAASHAFAATGGSYTLTAKGKTYTNGVLTSTVNLSASDLTITRSGSGAITRSGLTFSAADLGLNNVAAATTNWSITWTANGSGAAFTTTQAANVITYAVETGVSTYTFSAAGGTYTLAVYGVTYRNGSEATRATLSASNLSFSSSGSTAISRSGLTFSAANLGTTAKAAQTTDWTLTWTANGEQAGVTTKQQANSSTPTGQSTAWAHHLPDTIIWTTSGTATADWQGDYTSVSDQVDEVTTTSYSWTSGATSSASVSVAHTGTLAVSGAGFYLNNGILSCTQNGGHSQRTGTLTLTYDIGEPDSPDIQTVTRSLTQGYQLSFPTALVATIAHDPVSYTVANRYVAYTRWAGEGGATYPYVYTVNLPSVGDSVYDSAAMTTAVGTINSLTY